MFIRKATKIFTVICFSILAFGIFCYFLIEFSASQYMSYNAYAVPVCQTGLVLGTSSRSAGGYDNLYFYNRIRAAEGLFRRGRVRKLILSGDNRQQNYNEPREMKKALIARGIRDSVLIPDYAGLRTFDSMVRAKEIFGQDTVIVISQKFHNARAIFIGRKSGLVVYGYNADKVVNQSGIKTHTREFFSRIKCVLDLYILQTKPRHLGEKILID